MNITLGLNWPQSSCHLIGNDTEVRGAQRGDYAPMQKRWIDIGSCLIISAFYPYNSMSTSGNLTVYRGLHTMISNQGTVLFYSSLKVELRSTLSLLRMNTLIVHRTKC